MAAVTPPSSLCSLSSSPLPLHLAVSLPGVGFFQALLRDFLWVLAPCPPPAQLFSRDRRVLTPLPVPRWSWKPGRPLWAASIRIPVLWEQIQPLRRKALPGSRSTLRYGIAGEWHGVSSRLPKCSHQQHTASPMDIFHSHPKAERGGRHSPVLKPFVPSEDSVTFPQVEPCAPGVPKAGTGDGSHPQSPAAPPDPAKGELLESSSSGEAGAELSPRSWEQQPSAAGEAEAAAAQDGVSLGCGATPGRVPTP